MLQEWSHQRHATVTPPLRHHYATVASTLHHRYIMLQERSQQEWFSLHAEQILQAERSMVGSCLSWRQLREGVLGYSSGPKPLVRSWTHFVSGNDAMPVRSTGKLGSSVDSAGTWYLEMEIYANASDLGVQPGVAPTDEQMSGMVAQVDSSVRGAPCDLCVAASSIPFLATRGPRRMGTLAKPVRAAPHNVLSTSTGSSSRTLVGESYRPQPRSST